MTAIATTPLSYNAFVTAMCELAVEPYATTNGVVTPSSADVQALIPSMLDYAELRIQRDLDILALQQTNTYNTASGNNVLSVPTADFVTVQTMSIAGTPLTAVAKDWLLWVYGTNAGATQPLYFAPLGGDSATFGQTSMQYMLGPYPDTTYAVSVTGTVRMPTLYNYANSTDAGDKYTWISTWTPDLLILASMIYVSAFQRNFSGVAANDPQMPVSYETQYTALLTSARVEEARKRFQASAWTSYAPPVAATPAR